MNNLTTNSLGKLFAVFQVLLWVMIGHSKAMQPGDSVTSGRYRSSSLQEIESGKPPRFSVVTNMPIKSSENLIGRYASFGPYRNVSNATVRVGMATLQPEGRVMMFATVAGHAIAHGPDSIYFLVYPGDQFSFEVTGFIGISVHSSLPGLTPEDVGFPSAASFAKPVGKFVRCNEAPDTIYETYLYEIGSMTDKSYIPPGPSARAQDLTVGVPYEGAQCPFVP